MKPSEFNHLTRMFPLPFTSENQKKFADYLTEMGLDLGNLYQELEMESKYVDTHQDSSYSNASVSLHSHAFYEILYCRNTCGAEYLVASNRYRLQKGDIILIPPGISHRPLLPDTMTEPYMRDVLWLSTDFLGMIKSTFPEDDPYRIDDSHLIRTSGTHWEFLGEKFRQGVVEAETRKTGWEVALVANTMQLIVMLRRAIEERTAEEMKAENPELLDRVMAYIEAHLSEKITLSEIAKKFYVSESTVSQLFRKKMGVSFYRCVTQRRLISAKNLILEGMILEQVAQMTGFSDYSTFYRAFKGEYGISPRQFRNQQMKP